MLQAFSAPTAAVLLPCRAQSQSLGQPGALTALRIAPENTPLDDDAAAGGSPVSRLLVLAAAEPPPVPCRSSGAEQQAPQVDLAVHARPRRSSARERN